MPFANVAVPAPVHGTFTYEIPGGSILKPGMRLLVPFRRQRRIGICIDILDSAPDNINPDILKPVEEILDEEPALNENLLKLIEWMSSYYLAPIGEVCRAALPNRMMKVESPRTTRPRKPADIAPMPTEDFELNEGQRIALDEMIDAAESGEFKPFLLHGITGSGKTEVYIRLFDHLKKSGKQGLLLVPEIALTPQLTGRAVSKFGDRVAVYHSGLTDAQRHEQWMRVQREDVDVIIGTRSALFSPIKNLGAIVVDEEHDGSYKQDDGFSYNARDAGVMRAHIEKIPIILGSATPSLESFANSRDGKYSYIHLPDRATGADLPTVEIIDMRHSSNKKRKEDDESCIPYDQLHALSPKLYHYLRATLDRGEQALLFVGRRGFASSVHCEDCGEVFICPNCDISLTAHIAKNSKTFSDRGVLRCHYCDYAIPMPKSCPTCSSEELTPIGHGTERLEGEINDFFPNARTARLDSDMTGGGGKRKKVLDDMRRGKIDILVGTQMVTKGHDFPSVTLVGVISADTLLHLPDFRSAEKTFQMLTQVAGRAGRGKLHGRVLIQTYQPEHPSLIAASDHDFISFADIELKGREELSYPPFAKLANIKLSSNMESALKKSASDIASILRSAKQKLPEGISILGPAPSPLYKLRGRYRWQILIKAGNPASLARFISNVQSEIRSKLPRNIRFSIDIDPTSML